MKERKQRIFVVDDDEALCRLLEGQLSALGCHAETASSAREAIRRIGRVNPDLILLDIRMPDVDGLELLKRLSARTRAPVVMMTAHADLRSARRAMRLGAYDYVTKPLGEEILRSILSDYLR